MSGASGRWEHVSCAQRVVFGEGCSEALVEAVRDAGLRRVMLVTTEGRLASPSGEALVSRLGRMLACTFSGVPRRVSGGAVRAALAQVTEAGAEGVVSFGGGSCTEIGKAVCFLAAQQSGAPAVSYLDKALLPQIAVPTTFSGAELTGSFAIADESTGRTTGAGGPTNAPACILYDPLLMRDLPMGVVARSGMSALAHAVDTLRSPALAPESAVLAVASFSRGSAALRALASEPPDPGAFEELVSAAVLGGKAFGPVGSGLLHGLAQLIGGRTGAPYGITCAVLLAHVVNFESGGDPATAARMGEALGDPKDLGAAVDELRKRLGLPGRLSECGVSRDDVEAVARMAPGYPAASTSGTRVGEDEVLELLDRAW